MWQVVESKFTYFPFNLKKIIIDDDANRDK